MKNFIIKGKPHHLRAAVVDLTQMGFVIRGDFGIDVFTRYKYDDDFVVFNKHLVTPDIDEYKELCIRRIGELSLITTSKYYKEFNLIHQYADLLEYVKEGLDSFSLPKFKKGDWVVFKHTNCIGRFLEPYVSGSDTYSYLTETYYKGNTNIGVSVNSLRLATEAEIIDHLLTEAKKRGLKEGVKYHPLNRNGKKVKDVSLQTFHIDEPSYDFDGGVLRVSYGTGYIYANGVFAEVVNQEDKKSFTKFGDDEVVVNHTKKKVLFKKNEYDFAPIIDLHESLTKIYFLEHEVHQLYTNEIVIGCAKGTIGQLRVIYYLISTKQQLISSGVN